ncbi:hypothetical protein QE152_g1917 [Popillia japonica]|uniref:Uncharacterized protein n=1 Tax=Popillia japonica TaxID=7064 RepID=A0AAW1N772_POPJA
MSPVGRWYICYTEVWSTVSVQEQYIDLSKSSFPIVNDLKAPYAGGNKALRKQHLWRHANQELTRHF